MAEIGSLLSEKEKELEAAWEEARNRQQQLEEQLAEAEQKQQEIAEQKAKADWELGETRQWLEDAKCRSVDTDEYIDSNSVRN